LQVRVAEFDAQQKVILDRITDVNTMNQAIGNRMGQEFAKARKEILGAITTRNHSPLPVPHEGKLRKARKDSDIRRTSTSHSRKASLQHSIESGKSFGKKAVEKGVEFFNKSFHQRRPSETAVSVRDPSFQYGQGTQLSHIDEQPPVARD
jgi:hypothetical protein